MVFTDNSTYSQAAVQQGYSAYTAQPNQGYAQTTQAYGQQSQGTYRQPTDVCYTHWHLWADCIGNFLWIAAYWLYHSNFPQAYGQPAQGYGTDAYDTNNSTLIKTQAFYTAQSAYVTQAAC